MCVPRYTCGGQGTTCGIWFSPTMWYGGLEFRPSGLAAPLPAEPAHCTQTTLLFCRTRTGTWTHAAFAGVAILIKCCYWHPRNSFCPAVSPCPAQLPLLPSPEHSSISHPSPLSILLCEHPAMPLPHCIKPSHSLSMNTLTQCHLPQPNGSEVLKPSAGFLRSPPLGFLLPP